MKRLVIKSLVILLAFFTTMPVFAAEADYDSNGVTAFYGEYEYPKEDPKQEDSNKEKTQDEGSGSASTNKGTQRTESKTTSELADKLPSYKGEGAIIPVTGDTSNLIVSLIGFALLAFVFLKLKEVEDAEKNSII